MQCDVICYEVEYQWGGVVGRACRRVAGASVARPAAYQHHSPTAIHCYVLLIRGCIVTFPASGITRSVCA